MKDLVQYSVSHDNFQRWLWAGIAPLTIWQGEKAVTMLTKLEKSPTMDYLYRISIGRDGSISWNNSPVFCGVYDKQNQALYFTEDVFNSIVNGQYPLVEEITPSMLKEINGKVNQRVEDTIANDRANLPLHELPEGQVLRDLQYYQKYGAKEEAIQLLFNGKEPDGQFHSGYQLEELPEAAFMAYLQDPEGFIQTEAEQHIKCHQEEFLLGFLENDALLEAYQSLMQDIENPLHRMRAITDALQASGAKTVTVSVQKDGKELTFKAAANSLTGHRNSYNTYYIPAQDRREFERLFGQHSDYKAEDIIRITYGRNTIYEAPLLQTEEQSESMGMGGIQFG